MIGYGVSILIALITLHKQNKLSYTQTGKIFIRSLIPLLAMILIVIGLKIVIPVNYTSKISCIIYVALIAIIGALVYLIIAYKMGLLQKIFGKEMITKLIKKFTPSKSK